METVTLNYKGLFRNFNPVGPGIVTLQAIPSSENQISRWNPTGSYFGSRSPSLAICHPIYPTTSQSLDKLI